MQRALYPKVFITPKGDRRTIRQMASALKRLRAADPMQQVDGWSWPPQPAHEIRNEIMRGIHDRINRRVPRTSD